VARLARLIRRRRRRVHARDVVVDMDNVISVLDPTRTQFHTMLMGLPRSSAPVLSSDLVIDMGTRDPRTHTFVGDILPKGAQPGKFYGVVREIRRKRWIEDDWTRETEWELVLARPWIKPWAHWLEDELMPRVGMSYPKSHGIIVDVP
jgi:hypothetical protein